MNMKKSVLFWAVCGLLISLTACEPTSGPQTPASGAFPKKHLLEEFTGQDCGYCPYGMNCVRDFIQNDTNWIVVLHHYGYSPDHFSVAGSKQITTKLSVSGAPNVTIDRTKTKSDAGTKLYFHPGYLSTAKKTQFADSTYASIELDNQYDAATRTLKVHVGGFVLSSDAPALKLTLMVKESGMVDYQADYYYTFNGWQEFRHCNAVRAFLTDPLGDEVTVAKQRYSADYELTISDKWVAENCAVVAVLSEDFKPVVQAEQKPVVTGTKGGTDIVHGGITVVPVADYYPEPGTDIAPSTYSGQEADTLTVATGFYEDYIAYGFRLWQIQAYSTEQTMLINKTKCVPFAMLMLFTSVGASSIPAGTYEFNRTLQPGTAYAGFRDDESKTVDGSMYYYTSLSYLQQGYLMPEAQWLVADGELVVTETGWELTGHARNGSNIHMVGTSAINNGGKAQAPARQVAQQAEASKARLIPIQK